jgi:lipopolysaccharide export LptBFGC system permease protein LptF
MPAGNQRFREAAFRQVIQPGYEGPVTLQKGHNEMTFSELRRQIAVFSASGQPREARQFSFVFHLRFSLAAAALALASVLLTAGATHRGLRASIALASCVAYWGILYAGEEATLRGYLPVPVAAWLPNVVFATATLFFASSGTSRLRDHRGVAQ